MTSGYKNPDIHKLGRATQFKPGNPGAKPGKPAISQRRLRKMMREAVPAVAACQLLGDGLDALKPLVVAQAYRRLTGDPKQTPDEWAVADRLLEFLFPRLQSAPPPAPSGAPTLADYLNAHARREEG